MGGFEKNLGGSEKKSVKNRGVWKLIWEKWGGPKKNLEKWEGPKKKSGKKFQQHLCSIKAFDDATGFENE